MKLLFDNNISFRIVKILQPVFPGCLHISSCGLSTPASDLEIWNYARANNLAVVTFDEDFVHIENLRGFPPKIIHLRFGNAPTKAIALKLESRAGDIDVFLRSAQHGVLEIF